MKVKPLVPLDHELIGGKIRPLLGDELEQDFWLLLGSADRLINGADDGTKLGSD